MRKILTVTGVIAVLAVVLYKQVNAVPENSILAKNIDALTSNEGGNSYNPCPDPYGVYNHYLDYTVNEATTTVSSDFTITILGKRLSVGGFSVGTKVKVTYHAYHCRSVSEGNCCPASRIGEIQIITITKK